MDLVLVSPRIRDDLHRPLKLFDQIDVTHFYFEGVPPDNHPVSAISLSDSDELETALIEADPDLVQAPEPFFGWWGIRVLRAIHRLESPYFIPWLETRSPREKFGSVLGSGIDWWTRRAVEGAEFIWPVTPVQSKRLESLDYDSKVLEPALWGTWGTVTLNENEPDKRYENRRFLFLGRLEPEKGITDLLEAWKQLDEKGNWTLDVAGNGSLRNVVEEFCRDYSSARYLGYLKWNELQRFWDRVSVLVSPSHSTPGWEEQVGMSNIQALGRGCPVISTRTGAIPCFVKHKKNGFLTEPESPESLARWMKTMMNERDQYISLSDSAHAAARNNLDRNVVIERAEKRLISYRDGELTT